MADLGNQVHKAMLRGRTKTKISSKSKMREQVVEAVKAHPDLKVKIGEPEVIPQIVKDKLPNWDQVRVLALEGCVKLDGPGETSDQEEGFGTQLGFPGRALILTSTGEF